MRFPNSSSWIFILLITSITLQCFATKKSRSTTGLIQFSTKHTNQPDDEVLPAKRKRTIKFEDIPLSIKKRLAENLQTIADYEDDAEDDDLEITNDSTKRIVAKRDTFDDNYNDGTDEEDNEEHENDKDLYLEFFKNKKERDARRQAEIDIAKSELEKVEKKVKEEIGNLKKLYKKSPKTSKRHLKNHGNALIVPRLVKIQVDTLNMGGDIGDDSHEKQLNQRDDRSSLLKRRKSIMDVKKRQLKKSTNKRVSTIDDRSHENVKKIEDAIQQRIDTLKDRVARQINDELRIEQIKKYNAKFHELQRLNKRNSSGNSMANDNLNIIDKHNFTSKIIGKRSTLHKHDKHHNHKKHRKSNKQKIRDDNKALLQSSGLVPSRAHINVQGKVFADLILDQKLRSIRSKIKERKNRIARRLRGPSTGKTAGAGKSMPKRVLRRLRKGPDNGKPNGDKVRRKIAINTPAASLDHSYRAKKAATSEKKPSHVSIDRQHREATEKQKEIINSKRNSKTAMRMVRAANEQLETNSGLVDSDGLDDVANSQDLSPMAPEYKEAFGGPSNAKGTSLVRYKRIKRQKNL